MKKCFFAMIANIFDQSSDIGFMIGLICLANYESKNDNDCPGINATYLLISSLTLFFFDGFVSAIFVYTGTKRVDFAIGQFLGEFMLYRKIWVNIIINYKLKCGEPCGAQKWLQNMIVVWKSNELRSVCF